MSSPPAVAASPLLVFSYGSNSACQLAGRVVAPGEAPLPPPRGAVLHGYARVFARFSSFWCVRTPPFRFLPPARLRRVLCALWALQRTCLCLISCPSVRACRDGGVADVVQAEGHRVMGAVCALTAAQAARLDCYERGYERTPVRVTLLRHHAASPGTSAHEHMSKTHAWSFTHAASQSCVCNQARLRKSWTLLRTS
jgi:hypothetical protein